MQLGQAGGERPFGTYAAIGSRRARLLGAREAVEDLELRRGQHQLAVLVLAVERQQRRARVAQIGRGRAAPAQIRARAALRAHRRASTSSSASSAKRSPSVSRSQVRQREPPSTYASAAPGRTIPEPAAAQQQVQRVCEHRLPRACLPREHVQSWTEAQLGPFDQQEVLDAEFVDTQGSTSGSGRIGRHFVAAQNRHRFGTVS